MSAGRSFQTADARKVTQACMQLICTVVRALCAQSILSQSDNVASGRVQHRCV